MLLEPLQCTLADGVKLSEVTFVVVDLETTGARPPTMPSPRSERSRTAAESDCPRSRPSWIPAADPPYVAHLTGIDDRRWRARRRSTTSFPASSSSHAARSSSGTTRRSISDSSTPTCCAWITSRSRAHRSARRGSRGASCGRTCQRAARARSPDTSGRARRRCTAPSPTLRRPPRCSTDSIELGGRLGIGTLGDLREACTARGRPNFGKIAWPTPPPVARRVRLRGSKREGPVRGQGRRPPRARAVLLLRRRAQEGAEPPGRGATRPRHPHPGGRGRGARAGGTAHRSPRTARSTATASGGGATPTSRSTRRRRGPASGGANGARPTTDAPTWVPSVRPPARASQGCDRRRLPDPSMHDVDGRADALRAVRPRRHGAVPRAVRRPHHLRAVRRARRFADGVPRRTGRPPGEARGKDARPRSARAVPRKRRSPVTASGRSRSRSGDSASTGG